MASVVVISPRESELCVEITSFKSRMPRYGALAITSTLKAHGHDARLYCEAVGSTVDWARVAAADYVCFSTISVAALRTYAMADRVRRELGRPVILGGSLPSAVPEDALEHADYVVRNEGEETLLDLIATLERGGDVAGVAGVSYRDAAGRPVHNPDRAFARDLSVPLDLDVLPEYRAHGPLEMLADTLVNGVPRLVVPLVQTTRGCAFTCRFCSVKHELGTVYRKRPVEVVLGEIDRYLARFGTRYLFFVDNDATQDSRHARALFQGLLDRHGPRLRLYLLARLGVSRDEELLRILDQFEEVTLFVGIESISDPTLADMNKRQTAADVHAALERLRRHKMLLYGLFLVGGEDDTPDTIRRIVDFSIEQRFYSIGLSALYDFPTREAVLGQPQLIPDHRFIHRDWRFFNNYFTCQYPRRMRPSQLQQGIEDGYSRFFEGTKTVYQYMPIHATFRKYVAYLQEVERPFYGRDDQRLDDRLAGRTFADLAPRLPITVPRSARYVEAARFYAANLRRATSWSVLLSNLLPVRTGPRRGVPGACG